MKLKKAETPDINDIPDMTEASDMAAPASFNLDAPASKSASGVGTIIAFIASLAAAALIGATAAMMYVNWGLVAEA